MTPRETAEQVELALTYRFSTSQRNVRVEEIERAIIAARRSAFEEAAAKCRHLVARHDQRASTADDDADMHRAEGARECADAIDALAAKERTP